MKKSVVIGVVIAIAGVILLIGIFFKEAIISENYGGGQLRGIGSKSLSLGGLCSDEESCTEFCLNNRGQCENYCKGRGDELCRIIFPPGMEDDKRFQQKENCISNPKPVFSYMFVDVAKISSVSQIGNNALYNPGSQARSYISIKPETGNMIPIYAPVNSTLTSISYAIRNLRTGAKGEYRLDFQVSCEVRYAFDHLADVSDKIKAFAPKVPANNTRSDTYISIPIQAGELLGYTDRNIIGGNWDFVFINTAHNAPHINPSRWTSDHSDHADCPYDYFIPELRDKYYALLEKSDIAEITCGPIVRDIPGSIAGYWFKDDANEEHGKRFGIYGGSHFVEFILANEKDFLFIRDGNPSRIAPSQVTLGKSACYFDSEKNAYVFLKMLPNDKIVLTSGTGACPSAFPEDRAEVFER